MSIEWCDKCQKNIDTDYFLCEDKCEEPVTKTDDRASTKPREWTIFDGWSDKLSLSGPDIAYADNVKVIEKSAYDALAAKLKEAEERALQYMDERDCVAETVRYEMYKYQRQLELKLQFCINFIVKKIPRFMWHKPDCRFLSPGHECSCGYYEVITIVKKIEKHGGLSGAEEETGDQMKDEFYRIARQAETESGDLREALTAERARSERLVEALKVAEAYLSCQPQTTFPINVREPDGSISQHRPPSAAAETLMKVEQAIAEHAKGEK